MRAWGLVALVLGGCLPTPHEIVGRRCDPQHPCGGELECHEGRCVEPLPCQPEQTVNADFEEGTRGWRPNGSDSAIAAESQSVLSGSGALRVYSLAGGTDHISAWPERRHLGLPAGKTLCAQAWVKGASTAGRITLYLRVFNAQGAYEDFWGELGRVQPSDERWERLVAWAPLRAPFDEAALLRLSRANTEATYFFIDAVRTWLVEDAADCLGQVPPTCD